MQPVQPDAHRPDLADYDPRPRIVSEPPDRLVPPPAGHRPVDPDRTRDPPDQGVDHLGVIAEHDQLLTRPEERVDPLDDVPQLQPRRQPQEVADLDQALGPPRSSQFAWVICTKEFNKATISKVIA